MYTVTVSHSLTALHYLAHEPGPESSVHAHTYQVELSVKGNTLDAHGFLIDVIAVQALLEQEVAMYEGKVLNDLPAFGGKPSIEMLAKVLWDGVHPHLKGTGITGFRVRICESADISASYEEGSGR
jgi:6-pyruvoyltetrahydropterin/6-carboxytetrahydropterin synthase